MGLFDWLADEWYESEPNPAKRSKSGKTHKESIGNGERITVCNGCGRDLDGPWKKQCPCDKDLKRPRRWWE